MKKSVALLTLLSLVQAASAQVNVPYELSLEDLSVGSGIITNPSAGAWDGSGEAFVTNVNYSSSRQAPVIEYPLNSLSHTNILKFSDAAISNSFMNTSGLSDIRVDTMIQPVFSEEPTMSQAISNSQVSMYFDTNGYVNVYHGAQSTPTQYADPEYRTWSTLSNSFGRIESGKWVRITIEMKHDADYSQSFFKILINGIAFSHELAYSSPDVSSGTNGSWFLCANYNGNDLDQIALSGSGMLDDLVVTTNAGSYGMSAPSVYVTYVGNGSVSPSGTVTLPASPGATNFNIVAAAYHQIAAIYTGAVAGVSNEITIAQGAPEYEVVWSNINADSTLFVKFNPILATNNTPIYWMAVEMGLTTNGGYGTTWDEVALYDKDGDGMITWQEYIAGTHPDNPASLLKILSHAVSNGVPRIVWLSSTSAVAPYLIQMSTNLLNTSWSNIAANVQATVGGTNDWTAPSAPATAPAFFRITVTN